MLELVKGRIWRGHKGHCSGGVVTCHMMGVHAGLCTSVRCWDLHAPEAECKLGLSELVVGC